MRPRHGTRCGIAEFAVRALALIQALASAALLAQGNTIVVAYDSGMDSSAELLAGIKETAGQQRVRAVDLAGRSGADLLGPALERPGARAVVAVGSRALAEVHSRGSAIPVVASLAEGDGELDGADAAIELDVPLEARLLTLREILPRCRRVGLLYNPARARYAVANLDALARKLGFTLTAAECAGPAQLLKALSVLVGKIDVLLCFPDADLYNAVTVRPLVLTTLQYRLPVVGYSPAFVRAGAALGIFADYREAGRQAGEMALRLAEGDLPATERPRHIRVAVNQRVLRMLGITARVTRVGPEVLE